jgi:hypothetical protein
MTIAGFNFSKINVEKKGKLQGKIDIKNNVSITGIEESSLNLASKSQKVARITFDFDINYEPKIGTIKFSGDIIFLATEEKIKKYVEEYKKSKQIPKEIAPVILNTILTKGNVLAIILSEQINLPPPIPLPKVQGTGTKKS